jgi:sRNA-binding protein
MILRKFPREVLEGAVRVLSDKYPACFFVDSRMRRPLKNTILEDLAEDRASAEELSAVGFYTHDWSYQMSLQAGVERVDLNGKKAGTVTAAEELAARKQVQAEKEAVKAIKAPAKLRVKPKDVLPEWAPVDEPLPAAPAAPVDPLARLQKLMATGAALYADTEDEALRAALAVTVLKQLRDEAVKAIALLDGGAAAPGGEPAP